MIMWKLLVLLNVLINFLILILIKSSLYSWIFESWILILIILESWIFLMNLEINLDLELNLEIILWAFCHHQNFLNQSWFIIMKFASTISPFFMMTTLESRNTYTFFFLVDHSLNSPYSPPLFLSLSFTWN